MRLIIANAGRVAAIASGWRILLWIAIVVATLIVTALALAAIMRVQRSRVQRRVRLELINRGNVRSRYALRAESPQDGLRFAFILDGVRLQGDEAPVTSRPTQTQAATQPTDTKTPNKAKNQAMGLGRLAADVLSTLGSILPRSVGSPLLQASARIRQGQATVRRVEQLPGRVTKVAPARPASAARPAAQVVATTSLAAGWVQTPFVEPGSSLRIELLIDPLSPYERQHRVFTVESRSLEQPGSPPEITEGDVRMVGLTALQWYAPFVATVIIAAAFLVIALSLIG